MGEYQEETEAIFQNTKKSFIISAVSLQKRIEDFGYKRFTADYWTGEIRFEGARDSYIHVVSERYENMTILEVFVPEDEWGVVKKTWGLIKEELKIEGGHRVEPPEDQDFSFKELEERRSRFFASQAVFKKLTPSEKDIVLAMVETDSTTYDQLKENWPMKKKKTGTIKSQVNNSIKKKLGYEGENWRVMQRKLKLLYDACSKSTEKE